MVRENNWLLIVSKTAIEFVAAEYNAKKTQTYQNADRETATSVKK
jgi:hypothetical protein